MTTSVEQFEKALQALWRSEGFDVGELPTVWRAQVAVWAADGVKEVDLRRFFVAWRRKPRIATARGLWRYLQVCCFQLTHPSSVRRWQADDSPDGFPGSVDVDPSGLPWIQRDPGPGW